MTAPKRIQRRRVKGWRMPEGAVYVGRPSKWGNPFTVMNGHRQGWLVWDDRDRLRWVDYETSGGYIATRHTKDQAVDLAVSLFRDYAPAYFGHPVRSSELLDPLAGRDLACWCPLDSPCHADVLLELANGGAS